MAQGLDLNTAGLIPYLVFSATPQLLMLGSLIALVKDFSVTAKYINIHKLAISNHLIREAKSMHLET